MNNRQRALNGALAAAVIGVGALGASSIGSPAKTQQVIRTAAVQKGDVVSTVTASGNVITPTNLNLAFTTGGKVTEIDVKQGDQVTTGQILARVDDSTQQAGLLSAQANLAAAQAKLTQLQNPVTPAQAAANNAALVQAAQAVTNAKTALTDTQRIVAGNAVSYQNAITQAQTQLTTDQNQQATDQSQLTTDQNQLTADQNQLASDQAKAQQDQGTAQEAADQQAVSADQQKVAADQQKVSADQTKVNQDNQTVAKDQQALTNAQQAQTQGLAKDQQTLDQAGQQVTSAQQAYDTAVANNAAKSAPPAPGDLASSEASVTVSQASLASAQQAEDGTVLKAPQDGTIGSINAIVGQTVSGGGTSAASSSTTSGSSSSASSSSSSSSPFMTLVELNGLQIKAGFSETDAANVKVGQPATATFPALPTEQLAAHVVAVDTTSTLVSNVVTYYVTLQIDNPTSDVKPGMTTNIAVVTARAQNVLHVPSAAVRGSGSTATIQVMKNGKESPVTVTIGVRGDTAVEIDSGVAVGDQVVVSTGSTGSGTTGTIPRTGGFGGGGLGGLGGGLGGGARGG